MVGTGCGFSRGNVSVIGALGINALLGHRPCESFRNSRGALLDLVRIKCVGQVKIKTVLPDPLTWGSLKAVDSLPVPGNMMSGQMISAPVHNPGGIKIGVLARCHETEDVDLPDLGWNADDGRLGGSVTLNNQRAKPVKFRLCN